MNKNIKKKREKGVEQSNYLTEGCKIMKKYEQNENQIPISTSS